MQPISSPQPIRFRFPSLYLAASLSIVLLAAAVPAFPQQPSSANPARITQSVDDSTLTKLRGNIYPLARPEFDRGAAPLSQTMQHMQLVLRRSPAQEANLESFLKSAQAKGSPNYHRWITPEQFGALYGPADADIETLTDWLTSYGFTINRVAKGRVTIDFSGSVGQVEDAFHTSMHAYEAEGVQFIASVSDPQIPSALAPVVAGITHLNTFPDQPLYVEGGPGKFNQSSHRFEAMSSLRGLRPGLTVANGEGVPVLYTVAADAATIYNTPNPTLNAKFSGGTTYDGTGVNIGIIGASAIDTTVVGNYRKIFLGDDKVPIVSNIDNVGDVPRLATEAYIDNEISGALAPGASVYYYTAGGLSTAYQAAIEDNKIDILSLSYLSCEMGAGSSGNLAINNSWQQAAAQGITVIVAAGDSGPVNCDYTHDSQGNPVTSAAQGFAVNGFASTPYDIAVGGTDFDVLKENFAQYVSTTPVQGHNGTALGYIPEAGWNDSTMNNTTASENVPWSASSGQQNIYAGGGGASSCVTFTSTGACAGGYAKPEWQKGNGVPNDNVRDLPDVSLLSGRGFYSATWGVCDDNSATRNGATVNFNCVPDSSGQAYIDGLGGTSSSAPAFAGIMALVVQKAGERQGAAAGTLYGLFSTNPSIFHDVTDGNNSVPCTITPVDSSNCVANALGNDFESGFNAAAGYDLTTGLGSVDVTALVNDWVSISLLSVTGTTISPAAVTAGSTGTSTITVTPGGGFTGAVNLACAVSGPSGASSPATCSLNPTPVTITATAAVTSTLTVATTSMTTPGNYMVTVNVADVATGNVTASASVTATVGPAGSIAISGTNMSAITAGSTGTSVVSVIPSGGFIGGVNLTCAVSGPSGGTSPATCSLIPTSVAVTGTAAATSTLTVATGSTTTPGSYTVSVDAADVVTGKATASASVTATVKPIPSIAIAGSSITAIAAGSIGMSTITVTPGGGFTGAVNLTGIVTGPGGATSVPSISFNPASVTISGTTSATSTLSVATTATTTPDSYTMTVKATDVATGNVTASNTITAVVQPARSFNLAATAATVSRPSQSGSSTITITPTNYTGTVKLTCTLASSPSGANPTYNPTCSVPATVTVSSSGAATATATFATTAPTSGALAYPQTNQEPDHRWYTAAAGTALACLLFFGIPARRRGWKAMLSLLVVLAAMTSVGCGGGGNNNNNNGTPGTTVGTYTFTVSGTDSVTSTLTAKTTVTLSVN